MYSRKVFSIHECCSHGVCSIMYCCRPFSAPTYDVQKSLVSDVISCSHCTVRPVLVQHGRNRGLDAMPTTGCTLDGRCRARYHMLHLRHRISCSRGAAVQQGQLCYTAMLRSIRARGQGLTRASLLKSKSTQRKPSVCCGRWRKWSEGMNMRLKHKG